MFESLSISIIGAGALGSALAHCLKQAGHAIETIASRRLSSAETLAQRVGAGQATTRVVAAATAQLVFLTTPDVQIAPVCAEIAQQGGFRTEQSVAHCSGLHSSATLQPARDQGAAVFSFHPLYPFAFSSKPPDLKGVFITLEGDAEGVRLGETIAHQFGARTVTISGEKKAMYHAGAVFASNYLVTVLSLARHAFAPLALADEVAEQMLMPLALKSLQNINEHGLNHSLTGPIRRGDIDTVRQHLKALQNTLPDLVEVYKLLGRHTLSLVPDRDRELESLLEATDFPTNTDS